jgi:hypothetical protein
MRTHLAALFIALALAAGPSLCRADVTLSDDFTDTTLAFQSAETGWENFAFGGAAPPSGAERTLRATRSLMRTRPAIVAAGPLGASWVLSTGQSTKLRDVHWGHYVDLVYRFPELFEGGSVALKYLNTRACGGRLDVLFAEEDETGYRLWEEAVRLEDWETWPGPYSQPRGQISQRTWRSYSLAPEAVAQLLQGRKYNVVIIREFDITSEAGSGYIDDVQVTATAPPKEEAEPEEPCAFPEDTLPPAGAVHAARNMIWPPNNKLIPIELFGNVRDELSIARDGGGTGVSSAYLLINGTQKIELKGPETNRLDDQGFFSLKIPFKAQRNAVYSIELFAADTAPGEPNFDLVDSTCIVVPANLGQALLGAPPAGPRPR